MVMVMVIATIKNKFNSHGNDDDGDDIDNDDGGVWFALLWRGWLKIFQNNSQWGWGPCFGGGLCHTHNHNTGNIKCDCKTINTCHSEFNDDDYTDITTYSIVNGTGTCIIPNRSHNHVNIDSDYIITIISVHIYITNCYQQQHASIAMTMTMTMTMTCIEIVIVLVMS